MAEDPHPLSQKSALLDLLAVFLFLLRKYAVLKNIRIFVKTDCYYLYIFSPSKWHEERQQRK